MHTLAPLPPRTRLLLSLALLSLIGLAWAYLIWVGGAMAPHGPEAGHCAAMSGVLPASPAAMLIRLAMWAVMGVAMMLPTAFPFISFFARYHRGRHPGADPLLPALHVAGGYLIVWVGFAIAAALGQAALERTGALAPETGALQDRVLGGLALAGAGAFQLSPLKARCLDRCRSPLAFVMTRWREGLSGASLMGLDHGLFCLGCCWALMLVMFVVGVMSLPWMAALAAVMLAEKATPHGPALSRLCGVALLLAAAWLALS